MRCSHCEEPVPEAAVSCPWCGSTFDWTRLPACGPGWVATLNLEDAAAEKVVAGADASTGRGGASVTASRSLASRPPDLHRPEPASRHGVAPADDAVETPGPMTTLSNA